MKNTKSDTDSAMEHGKLYLAAWRWHFYAGLYVIPFLVILAITGLGMLWTSALSGRDGERTSVIADGSVLPVSLQADAARRFVPDGELVQYLAPLPSSTDLQHEHHASGGNADAEQMPTASAQAARSSTPVTLDRMAALARSLGFESRYQLHLPASDTGVWTISRDSMSSDSRDATTDRTVHVDQYSGEVLADIGFADYSIYGKAMAAGVGFHMGTLGWWNVILNTVFCCSVIFLCVSGVVMWWLRRPTRVWRLGAPPAPSNMPQWRGAALCGLAIALFFRMAGLALLAIMALDYFVISRVPTFRRAVS